MDKETLEQEIDKLLKEQEEIRVLVSENRDAYLPHLYVNLSSLYWLYVDTNQQGKFKKFTTEFNELALEIIKNSPIFNAHPQDKPL